MQRKPQGQKTKKMKMSISAQERKKRDQRILALYEANVERYEYRYDLYRFIAKRVKKSQMTVMRVLRKNGHIRVRNGNIEKTY